MPKPECFYIGSDNMCCRPTSEHHCKTVTSEICDGCIMKQVGAPEPSGKQQMKNAISKALEVLPMTNKNQPAVDILTKALRL